MSGTFPCPHCGAQYPRKPVLVGKTVRCTSCKNAFILRDNGIADKVQPAPLPVAAPSPSPAAAPDPVRPASTPAPVLATAAIVPAPPAGAPSSSASASVPSVAVPTPVHSQATSLPSRRALTQKAEATRRAMAATLSDAMSGALAAESVKREDEKRVAEVKRKARQQEAATPGEAGQGKLKPAVLTGEGEREARLSQQNWLIGLGLVVIIGGLVWLMGHAGPKDAALLDFTRPPENRVTGGMRVRQIQERALLLSRGPGGAGVAAFVELGKARYGQLQVIDGAALAPSLATISGFTYFSAHAVWTAPSDRDLFLKVMGSIRDPAKQFADAAAKAKLKYVYQQDLVAAWKTAGLNDEAIGIVTALLIGETSAGTNDIAQRLTAGKFPSAIEWIPFFGPKGTYLIDIGNQTKYKDTPYRGKLLRLVGEGWPGRWKVFELSADAGNRPR